MRFLVTIIKMSLMLKAGFIIELPFQLCTFKSMTLQGLFLCSRLRISLKLYDLYCDLIISPFPFEK